jgi:6-phosphogluconolactonase
MPAEVGAGETARLYEKTLLGQGDFDLVLLGLGEDAHTASLFPGQDWGVGDTAPDVLAVFDAPKPPPERVSLSARRLSAAREVVFLVSGEGKRQAVTAWRAGHSVPAAAIAPAGGADILIDFA